MHILAFEGKHKLSDRFEEDAYVVAAQPNNDVPVYVVHREGDASRRRTLHRNHLFPIYSVPTGTEDVQLATGETRAPPAERPHKKKTPRATRPRDSQPADPAREDNQSTQPTEDTDEEEDAVLVQPDPVTDTAAVVPPTTEQPLAPDAENETPPDAVGDGHTEPAGDGGPGHYGDGHLSDDIEVQEQPGQPNDVEEGEIDGNVAAPPNDDAHEEEEEEPPSARRSERIRRPPDRYEAGLYCVSQAADQSKWREKMNVLSDFMTARHLQLESKDIAQVITSLLTDK